MSDHEQIIDLADSLSRKCQESVKGFGITFRCNDNDFSAEEAFAADKLFPMFLDMAMKLPQTDPELRVVQCRNLDYLFEIQAVVPSRLHAGIEQKWESRLQQFIASYEAQGGTSPETIDLTDLCLHFAISSSWSHVPTFDSVESALDHYRSSAI